MKVLRMVPFLLVFGLVAIPLSSECVNSDRGTGDPSVNGIKIIKKNIPPGLLSAFQRGYGNWNSTTCNPGLDSFPHFSEATGERLLTIEFHSGFHPVKPTVCGEFEGAKIDLYEKAMRGTTVQFCSRGDIFEDTVSHELGHALGLNHPVCGSCSKYIMQNAQWTSSGYINRTIQNDECQKVRDTNETTSEREEGSDGSGGADSPDDEADDGNTPPTPIIIDYLGDGFHLTGIDDPVAFDIDADGLPEILSWTDRRRLDLFLCFDRNGNGRIDNGAELFGNATPLASGATSTNGFQPLFEIDEAGNRNGFVDAGDPTYSDLCGWRDFNHNGRSEPFEIESLEALGITAVAVEYRVSPEEDEHGNRFKFVSSAHVEEPSGELRRVDAVDVFFVAGRRGSP